MCSTSMDPNPNSVRTRDEKLSPNKPDFRRTVSVTDVNLGELIGSGAFASVYEVQIQQPIPDMNSISSLDSSSIRINGDELASSTCTDETDVSGYQSSWAGSQSRKFALKRLSASTISDPEYREVALQGLKTEANILSALPTHDHIIQLRYISDDWNQNTPDRFLVLELLEETLEKRLRRWRNRKLIEERPIVDRCKRWLTIGHANDAYEQGCRAWNIGLAVAKAMSFLHKHKILYRDLKPANIGFDSDGKVRLFDFGLARYLEVSQEDEDRNLTICVGSLRYMSPEVAMGDPYGFSSDVYSYAILLWEICTLKCAFSKAKCQNDIFKFAFYGGNRPSLRRIALPEIKDLLRASWDPNPKLRPSFAPLVSMLNSTREAHTKQSYRQGKR